MFNTEVLATLRIEIADEIIFIQSDNGQLDTTNVKAYIRRHGVYQRFTLPYHHNMNGFIERAFRSMNDMARSMMIHAGLPDPYGEKRQDTPA